MAYTIDPASFGGMFALPASLADDRLAMASGSFLKAILYIYRHADAPVDPAAVAAGTGLSADETADALLYWAEEGYLREDAPAPAPAEETAQAAADAQSVPAAATAAPAAPPPEKETIRVKPTKPTYAMICQRMKESEAVRFLFAEAQLRLGRTIGTADQASLLLLHDYYGLPVEVILTICEYASSHGKANNISYIYTVGVDWSRREIDTLELADAEFSKMETVNARWEEFRRRTGVKNRTPTKPQLKYFTVWTDEWHFPTEVLLAAFEQMSKNTADVSFPYMHKILSDWHKNGVTSAEAAEAAIRQFAEEKDAAAAKKAKPSPYGVRSVPQQPEDRPASYDIEKAMREMQTTVPKVRKKEKR